MKIIRPRISGTSTRWRVFAENNVSLRDVELIGTSYVGFATVMTGGMIRSDCQIGRYCSIGRGVRIGLGAHDHSHLSTSAFLAPSGEQNSAKRLASVQPRRRVIIGNDVWIGDGVFINSGVRIGDGAVLGAGAVVVEDVQPYQIVGGVPARHLKWRFEPDVIEGLLRLQWWRYDPQWLQKLPSDPREVLEMAEQFSSATLSPYDYQEITA